VNLNTYEHVSFQDVTVVQMEATFVCTVRRVTTWFVFRRFKDVSWSHIKGLKCQWRLDTGHVGPYRPYHAGHSFVIHGSRWQDRIVVALLCILSALIS